METKDGKKADEKPVEKCKGCKHNVNWLCLINKSDMCFPAMKYYEPKEKTGKVPVEKAEWSCSACKDNKKVNKIVYDSKGFAIDNYIIPCPKCQTKVPVGGKCEFTFALKELRALKQSYENIIRGGVNSCTTEYSLQEAKLHIYEIETEIKKIIEIKKKES